MATSDFAFRQYQVEAIDAVHREWEYGRKRTMIVMATGTGKTTVFGEIVRRHYERSRKRALVLAHRIELVRQAANRLRSLGVECEIESGESRASPLGCMFGSGAVVATVQTLRSRRLASWPRDSFGLIVVDECHHATAEQYTSIIDHFSDALVLGVTATPDRGDGVALGTVFDSVAYSYSIEDGIRDGYLCDLRCIVIDMDCVSLEGAKVTRQEHGRDFRVEDLDRILGVDKALHAIAAPLVEQAGSRQTIVFTPSVAVAHELARTIAAYSGPSKVASLDGSSTPEYRAHVLSQYARGEVQYLVNCALFTEGFDAPNTSCVAIARPTLSRALYAQMVGRGTRIAEGKTDCLVIDFCPSNSQHSLSSLTDIFDGKSLPEPVKRKRDEYVRSGVSVKEATEKAKEWAKEQEERRQKDAERSRVVVKAKYEAVSRHWSLEKECGIDASMRKAPPATKEQIERMARLKIEISPGETMATASAKIREVSRRMRAGLCTLKQARLLAKYGLPTNMKFEEAKSAIDAIAGNGWSLPAWLRAKYSTKGVQP